MRLWRFLAGCFPAQKSCGYDDGKVPPCDAPARGAPAPPVKIRPDPFAVVPTMSIDLAPMPGDCSLVQDSQDAGFLLLSQSPPSPNDPGQIGVLAHQKRQAKRQVGKFTFAKFFIYKGVIRNVRWFRKPSLYPG